MAPTLDQTANIEILSIPVSDELERHERLINIFARCTQFFSWPLLYVILHLFFEIRFRGRENFSRIRGPFILIANHIDFYDSFLFRLALGVFSPHLPLRFMGVRKFNVEFLNKLARVGIVDFIYSLFGVFTIIPGRGIEKNLVEAKEIIKVGGNVVIYPEGKIFKEPGVAPFKKGAAVLMKKTGAPVMPVSMRLIRRKFRSKLLITIGEPIVPDTQSSIDQITKRYRDVVSRMFEKRW
jgi:1-acyl-sn-glycerol-3-phosphate acyltransferase